MLAPAGRTQENAYMLFEHVAQNNLTCLRNYGKVFPTLGLLLFWVLLSAILCKPTTGLFVIMAAFGHTVLYSLRGWSQIWNKHIILHLLWSHLACPYECAALLFSPIECPELLLTYYDLKEWDFFVNNNTEKAKLISSSQEVSECLINTGWSE